MPENSALLRLFANVIIHPSSNDNSSSIALETNWLMVIPSLAAYNGQMPHIIKMVVRLHTLLQTEFTRWCAADQEKKTS